MPTFALDKQLERIARTLRHQTSKDMEQEILDKLRIIEEQNKRIEQYTLLAAKNVLQIADVALLTGLSKASIYRLTSQNGIPYYKRTGGGYIYFDRKEIEDWMRTNRVATSDEIQAQAATYCVTHR